jgi:hypothetical protein
MRRLAIAEDDTAGSLSDKLARLGADEMDLLRVPGHDA